MRTKRNTLVPTAALFLLAACGLHADTHYVSLTSDQPTPPYTNWATAALTIQEAVDAAVPGDEIVVTNGLYASGSRDVALWNTNVSPPTLSTGWPSRVVVTNAIRIESVNGPDVTVVDGGREIDSEGELTAGVRCVYLGDGVVLNGFTLTNGLGGSVYFNSDRTATGEGGGVLAAPSAVVTNCVIVGNMARKRGGGACGGTLYDCVLTNNVAEDRDGCCAVSLSDGEGGGAYGSTLYRCRLIGNSSTVYLGGGACQCVLNDCDLMGNSADQGGGASSCTLDNCRVTGNEAWFAGGGVDDSYLTNCTLISNSAYIGGGGVHDSFLTNCTLISNSASDYGGGAWSSTLVRCWLRDNTADVGGGAAYSTLYSSTLSGNSGWQGGGAFESALYNCALTSNSAQSGGGATSCRLANCALTANLADGSGGGASYSTLVNSIVYFNVGPSGLENYCPDSALSYCCTQPLPTNGIGNLAVAPQLADLSHLSPNSPCRGAGSAAYATGTDIDGEPWSNPPSIGCDEFHPENISGPLSVAIRAERNRLVPGYTLNLTALIEGRNSRSFWDLGDGTIATNQPCLTRPWATPGDYRVVLWAFNETYPEGVSATLTVRVGPSEHYVDVANAHPVWPFTSWASAATNIQDAVDAANPGSVVLVTNGVYASGVVTANADYSRVRVGWPLTLRSVNGPQFTIIDGGGQMRCVDLANGSVLSGFTLTNGNAYSLGGGGGVRCEATAVVSNCLIVGNSAVLRGGGAYGGSLYACTLAGNAASDYYGGWSRPYWAPGRGGGASDCTLYDCVLTGNRALYGGGARDCTLNGCTLAGNSADYSDWRVGGGGGASASTLNNCIVYFNTCTNGYGANYEPSTNLTLNYCCTTPLPTNGLGNITSPPLFVDTNGWSNLRLQTNSPCINAGNNAYASGVTDLDGNPRIAGATLDIGAYEFQGVGLGGFPAWLWQYGQPIDGSADAADPDHDCLNNQQEWVCATCPTNSQSALRLLSPTLVGTNLVVTWSSVAGMDYYLERSTNLTSPFSLMATNLVGQEGLTSYEDTHSTGGGPFFYRVGVTCR